MSVDLVFITRNRLAYTKRALASVLSDPDEQFFLTIWDNASTDGTVEYLRQEANDPRICDIIFSRENIGQTAAVNRVWSNSKAELLGKVDNDCLVTPGWTRKLAQAHEDISQLGVVACWHFFPEDFDYERAKTKIQQFGKHQIFRHPWTCGTGLLIKRSTFRKFGPLSANATTKYWLTLALGGYINGFYYPLIYQEHMDDPRSDHCRLQEMAFEQAYRDTYGYQTGAFTDLEEYRRLHDDILDNLLAGPYDPKYYTGWRAKVRRIVRRVAKTATRNL
jgi:glycosyltransferase involved in cell wall biosynthesis